MIYSLFVVVGFLFFCALTEDLIERKKHPQDLLVGFFVLFLTSRKPTTAPTTLSADGVEISTLRCNNGWDFKILIPTMWPKIFLEISYTDPCSLLA